MAYEAFAAEDLGVPIDEIARRAGVGAGTLCRHFPTKEAQFGGCPRPDPHFTERAEALDGAADPGAALRGYFAELLGAASNQGFVEAMSGSGFDVALSAPWGKRPSWPL